MGLDPDINECSISVDVEVSTTIIINPEEGPVFELLSPFHIIHFVGFQLIF
jgi:hypothetical protein